MASINNKNYKMVPAHLKLVESVWVHEDECQMEENVAQSTIYFRQHSGHVSTMYFQLTLFKYFFHIQSRRFFFNGSNDGYIRWLQ